MAQQLRFEQWRNPDDARTAAVAQATAQGANMLLSNLIRGKQQKSMLGEETKAQKELIRAKGKEARKTESLRNLLKGEKPSGAEERKRQALAEEVQERKNRLADLYGKASTVEKVGARLPWGLQDAAGNLQQFLTGEDTINRIVAEEAAIPQNLTFLKSGAAATEPETRRMKQSTLPNVLAEPESQQRFLEEQVSSVPQVRQTAGASRPKVDVRGNVAPKQGTVEQGYIFMGGDPSDPKNWKKATR